MLRTFLLGIAAATGLTLQPLTARAGLLVYESFDYTAGAALDGVPATGLNLTGSYASSTPLMDLVSSSPGLNYGNLTGNVPSVAGNRLNSLNGVTAGAVEVAVDQDVLTGPGTETFFSALFTFDDSLNRNHFARISLFDDAGGSITFGEASVGVGAIRIEADTAATGGLIADGADGAFSNGQTLWLIGRYLNNAAGDDALELVGYDTALAQSVAPSFSLSDPNAEFAFSLSNEIDLANISSIEFSIRGTNNNFIDELRIGQTYADVTSTAPAVVPEPATGVLLLVGLGVVGCARRRMGLAAAG